MLNKNLTDRVMGMLKTYPTLRENDSYLISMIWRDEIGHTPTALNDKGENTPLTAHSFLGMLARHEVSSPESIRRTRQKIQENNPDLRGPNYSKRKDYEEIVLREIEQCGKDASPQIDMIGD